MPEENPLPNQLAAAAAQSLEKRFQELRLPSRKIALAEWHLLPPSRQSPHPRLALHPHGTPQPDRALSRPSARNVSVAPTVRLLAPAPLRREDFPRRLHYEGGGPRLRSSAPGGCRKRRPLVDQHYRWSALARYPFRPVRHGENLSQPRPAPLPRRMQLPATQIIHIMRVCLSHAPPHCTYNTYKYKCHSSLLTQREKSLAC